MNTCIINNYLLTDINYRFAKLIKFLNITSIIEKKKFFHRISLRIQIFHVNLEG